MTYPLEYRAAAVPFEVIDADERGIVVGRVVPYGEVADYFDHEGRPGKERFLPGALAQDAKALHLWRLTYDHSDLMGNAMGYGVGYEERHDGAYGRFRLYPSTADHARDILTSSHAGLSLAFYSLRSRRALDGVTERLRVRLHHVAAVQDPAYADARVLAVRRAPGDVDAGQAQGDAPAEPVAPAQPAERPRLAEAQAELAYVKMTPAQRADFDRMQQASQR